MKQIILLALLAFLSCVPIRAENLKASSLAVNEEIQIEIHSIGCFHASNRKFLISGKNGMLVISERRFEWDEGQKKSIDRGVHLLGSLTLSPQDRAGIDALCAFYRANTAGGCTSVDSISFEYRRSGKVVGRESFIDASCATSMIELYEKDEGLRSGLSPEVWRMLRNAVPFWRLEARLKKKTA
jgi:hypothetical protein